MLHRREVSSAKWAIGLGSLVAAVAAGIVLVGVWTGDGRSDVERLIGNGLPVYCGGGTGPYVALTFDDGPSPWSRQLTALLRANGTRATFFEIGQKAARHPDLVRLEAATGEIGDHSWSHPALESLTTSRITEELERADRVESEIGGQNVQLARPPFGATDPRVAEVARQLGLLVVLWNVDSGDASAATTPPSRVVARQLAERVRAGAIVLLHEDETVPTALGARREFLPELRQRGLHAVTVSDLLRLDPPSRDSIGNRGACHSTWTG